MEADPNRRRNFTQIVVGIFDPNARRNFSQIVVGTLPVLVTAFDEGEVAAPIDQAIAMVGGVGESSDLEQGHHGRDIGCTQRLVGILAVVEVGGPKLGDTGEILGRFAVSLLTITVNDALSLSEDVFGFR